MIPLPSFDGLVRVCAVAFVGACAVGVGFAAGRAVEATDYAWLVNEARVAADYAHQLCGPMSESTLTAAERTLLASLATRSALTAEIESHGSAPVVWVADE